MESLIHKQLLDEYATCMMLTSAEVAQLVWEKPGCEFRYQGQLFDVIAMNSFPDGSLDISCIQDKKESAIERAITRAVDQDHQSRSEQRSILIHWFDFFNSLFMSGPVQNPSIDLARLTGHFSYLNFYMAFSQVSSGEPPEA